MMCPLGGAPTLSWKKRVLRATGVGEPGRLPGDKCEYAYGCGDTKMLKTGTALENTGHLNVIE